MCVSLVTPTDVVVVSTEIDDASLMGVADEGWDGDLNEVRLGLNASAASKFAWLRSALFLGAISERQTRRQEEGIEWWTKLVPYVARRAMMARQIAARTP